MGGSYSIYFSVLTNWCGERSGERNFARSGMKNTRQTSENQSDLPMTMESLAMTLRDHTASQVDTNRRFAESFHELEKNAKAMESRIEETLEAKIEACYEKM